MKYEIENYKGQLIEYDDDYDKFVCDISVEDKWKTTKRLSLKDIKKEIDQFIKLNLEFKPFKALELSVYDSGEFKEVEVTAIRTDGKFVVCSGSSKSYYNEKDMRNVMVYDADVVKAKKEISAELDVARKKYRDNLTALTTKLTPVDVSQWQTKNANE